MKDFGEKLTDTGNAIDRAAVNLVVSPEFVVVLPLIGTALAVIYDVGYFSGIGLFYFTIFSVAEHVVFALAFLPFAILVTVIFVVYISFAGRLETHAVKHLRAMRRIVAVMLVAILITGLILVDVFFVHRDLMLILLVFGISGAILIRAYNTSPSTAFVCGLLAATVCVFVAGRQVAISLYSKPGSTASSIIELENGKQIPVRIIRTGERGILFADATSPQITLVRWVEVKQIVSNKPHQ